MRLATASPERYLWAVSEETEPTPADETAAEGPVDQLGIPMNREPTLDDVRSDGVEHRRLAVGCTLAVAALLIGFYVLRVVLLR